MALTDIEIRNLVPTDKEFKRYDAHGLYILVTPSGGKLWRFKYEFAGKAKKLSNRPLSADRPRPSARGSGHRPAQAQGRHRSGARKQERKQEALRKHIKPKTFADWASEWLAKEGGMRSARTMAGKTRNTTYLTTRFGRVAVDDVTRAAAIDYLREFEREGKLETRDRIRATGESIFRFADVDRRGINPFRNLDDQFIQNVSEPRPARTKPSNVADLMQKIAAPFNGAHFQDVVGHALKFIALTAVRPGEVASAEWIEIDFDTARWIIPAAKMKMKKDHIVPLARQAIAILRQMQEITGDRRHVFSVNADEPLSDNTLNKRLRLLGIDTANDHCAHGFRSTFSTLLNAETDRDDNKVWDSDLIEMQLAHLDESSVKAVYNRDGATALLGPRRKLMQHWSDRIDRMREPTAILSFPATKPAI